LLGDLNSFAGSVCFAIAGDAAESNAAYRPSESTAPPAEAIRLDLTGKTADCDPRRTSRGAESNSTLRSTSEPLRLVHAITELADRVRHAAYPVA